MMMPPTHQPTNSTTHHTQDLTGKSFTKAVLRKTDFSRAKLRGACVMFSLCVLLVSRAPQVQSHITAPTKRSPTANQPTNQPTSAHTLATGVSFFSALCEGAKFAGADMTLADLESGNFEDADLQGAVLEGAYVNNAQVRCLLGGNRSPCSAPACVCSEASSRSVLL